MRFLGKVVLVTAALAAVGAVGLRVALQRQLPDRLLKHELEKALGHQVRYGSFQLTWDAQLTLHQVEMLDGEGQVFLKVDRAELDFDRSRALEGRLVLLRLLLDEPDLTLSGARWRQLSSRRSGPSARRDFPLLLHSLDLRWLDEKGQLSWEIHDWQGSLPPVAAGQWRVALQGGGGEVIEAGGQTDELDLKFHKFPASRLATLVTGTNGFEPQAQVDLEAHRRQGIWRLDGQLRSRAYTGPVQLELAADHSGTLTTESGELYPLGKVEKVRLPFGPGPAEAWRFGPAQVRWRGADWQLEGQVRAEDKFAGQAHCAALAVPLPAGWRAGPADFRLEISGSAVQQRASFKTSFTLPALVAGGKALGDWSATADGQLRADGLPNVNWRVSGPRGSWPGTLSWNAQSGDLEIDFEPLRVEKLLSGWQGQLSGKLRRQGQDKWDLRLSLPALRGPSTRIEKAQVSLDGQPPRWSGRAFCNGVPLVLSGALATPSVEGKISEKLLNIKDLHGEVVARMALLEQRQLRLEVVKHNLAWRGQALPRVEGALVGSGTGWKSESLALVSGPLKVPLTLTGGWHPRSWKVEGRLPPVALGPWLKNRLEAQAQGRFSASYREVIGAGELKGVRLGSQSLGDWKVEYRQPKGKPGRLKMLNPALPVPQVGKVKASLVWQSGSKRADLELSAPRLSLAGVALGPASLHLSGWHQGPLRLSGQVGPAKVSGSVDPAQGALDLEGQLQKFSVAAVPGLPPGSGGTLAGNWSAQGRFSQPKLVLTGLVSDLKILNFKLGDLAISASHAGNQTQATLGPVAVEGLAPVAQRWPQLAGQLGLKVNVVKGQPPDLIAQLSQASYADKPVPNLRLTGTWKSLEVQKAHLVWQVEPVLELTGVVGMKSQLSGDLTGQSLQALCLGIWPVAGQAFGKLDLSPQPAFVGELRGLSVAGQHFGRGQVKWAKGRLQGQDFEASEVSLLQQRYPELQAQLAFDLGAEGSSTFRLSGGRWRGQAFPDVAASAQPDKEKSWQLTAIKINLQPVLQSSGRMWPEQGRLELSGKLDGQSLADLTLVAGGSRPPDLFTRLSGNYHLMAQGQQVNLTFQGETQQMTYRGVALGDGQLQLTADPELRGELLLRQPLELGNLADVPAGLKSVLPVSQFLSSVRLRGVKLGGTLETPSVSPLWSAPEIKVTLPGGIPIKF